ncbi:MAG TPA: cation diffusion facilitator family transporter [Firmicutes bacterium]|nr:cation diffusion facilitator family transporter [Bacillota bacterium]
MTNLLIRLFIRNPEDTRSSGARYAYGRLAGAAGLCANLLLFLAKLLAGLFSSSMAIVADAFNNLSDAGSSVVTLVGFKLSSAPPDKEHPFGHGRMEYLTAMAVAVMIMLAGVELAKSSVDKILHPTGTDFRLLSVGILAAAVVIKLWMAAFYRDIGRRIGSEALRAAAADSRNDVICTGVVLLSTVIGRFTGWEVDGWVGAAVALFVLWSGFSVLRDTVSPLLGQAPDPAMVQGIRDTVLSHEGIIGVHDLMVHNYGPGRCVISLHAEVPAHEDMLQCHDLIDRIEKEIAGKYNSMVCIHMDPVETDDPKVEQLLELTREILREIDPGLSLHDFRVVFGNTHTNLIFDVVVPFGYREADGLCGEIQHGLWERDPNLFAVATVEHSYT